MRTSKSGREEDRRSSLSSLRIAYCCLSRRSLQVIKAEPERQGGRDREGLRNRMESVFSSSFFVLLLFPSPLFFSSSSFLLYLFFSFVLTHTLTQIMCFAVVEELNELSVGLKNGAVMLFSGDLIRDHRLAQLIIRKEGPVPVTGI